jgi:NAD(P)-dependent dehydrogenase (short-subunit alcohol dehydrogenase family)
MTQPKAALIGGAIARRFAREGFSSDARDEAAVTGLVARIEREIAPIEVAVFNVGADVRFAVTDTTERSIARSGRWAR